MCLNAHPLTKYPLPLLRWHSFVISYFTWSLVCDMYPYSVGEHMSANPITWNYTAAT